MNEKVDAYINGLKKWKQEVQLLREILSSTELDEDFKWSRPCYTYNGKNIVGIATLKEHCALNIFNGASLTDPNGILIIPGEHTQSGRWMKFDTVANINKHTKLIKSFIKEAIELEVNGVKLIKTKPATLALPVELETIFKKDAKLKKAFNALTPGRQRAYLIYFSGTKNAQTVINRIEKYTPKILCGKGFNDCTCGLSKRMPNCDGSHKFAKT
ncbi:MAG: hypothetical protein RI940_422 [Bacteroidota bacterium]